MADRIIPGGWMQLSIRDASRYVTGMAILREMTNASTPLAFVTFDNVAAAASRTDKEGENLRAAIERLADQESEWFRTTPPHTLTSDRVMRTREHEVRTLNNIQLAALATVEWAARGAKNKDAAASALQPSYQAAIQSIDKMPGSVDERRALLRALEMQTAEASGAPAFVRGELKTAERTYLEQAMDERMAAYRTPSVDDGESVDLDQ
jgi:hypothetical protein